MRRRFLVGITALLVVGMLAIPGLANADHANHLGHSWTRTLTASLTGEGEVPPVNSDAAGLVRITIDRRKHLLCYELVASGIEVVAGHLHKARAGTNGAPVVDFSTFGEEFGSTSAGCTLDVSRALLRDIVIHPKQYDVNLHTETYPGGEIRGQLAER